LTSPLLATTTTMSFARIRLAARIASHLRFPSPNGNQSSLIAYRLLSTTSRRSHAEPVNVKHHQDHFPPDRLDPSGGLRSPPGTAMLSAQDEAGKSVNPYKGGPSAIDKAVHLFFFTEILRGMNVLLL
jgi:NADH dehydrogenase (ubiquinone) Fe-S protein 8